MVFKNAVSIDDASVNLNAHKLSIIVFALDVDHSKIEIGWW